MMALPSRQSTCSDGARQNQSPQILIRRRQHQLNPIELIHLTGPRIIIDGHNIGERIPLPDLLDHPFSHHMIGQAAEGLTADDIARTAFDQLDHLAGQKPPFAGLIADIDDRLRIFHQLIDTHRGMEPGAFLESLRRASPQKLKR